MPKFQWNRKAKILAASFLAAAFLVSGGFALQGHARAAEYRRMLQSSYQHAFSELTTAVNELDVALQKSVYVFSPALAHSLYTEIFGKAMSAQMAIGELPYGNLELEQTAALIAKVGDYAMALSRAAAMGSDDGDRREGLRSLSQSVSSLSEMLGSLHGELYAGSVQLEDLAAVEARLSSSTESGDLPAGGSFQDIESQFPEVPALIYDGPFSEHLANRTSKQLQGRGSVTQEDALQAAAAFLGLKPDIFSFVSAGAGKIPTYGFSAAVDGGELYMEVTQTGGLVIELMNSRTVNEATLDQQSAVRLAQEFLTARGYPDLRPTYFIDQDHILTINFAAVQGDVLCYPDLIKVSIALDTGSIIGFEAEGYLMNHTLRMLDTPAVSVEEAQMTVPEELHVLSTALTLIPTSGEKELLCHEFKCEGPEGRHYLLYVNALTGDQERILILLEDESGALVI